MKMMSGTGDCACRGAGDGADNAVTNARSNRLRVHDSPRIPEYIVGRIGMSPLKLFRSEASTHAKNSGDLARNCSAAQTASLGAWSECC